MNIKQYLNFVFQTYFPKLPNVILIFNFWCECLQFQFEEILLNRSIRESQVNHLCGLKAWTVLQLKAL